MTGHTPDETGGLTLAFRSREQFGPRPFADGHPGTFGGSPDRGEFVVGEADGYGVAARVAAGRSAELGHAPRIAHTETLDYPGIGVYGKSMTTTQNTEGQTVTVHATNGRTLGTGRVLRVTPSGLIVSYIYRDRIRTVCVHPSLVRAA